MTGPRREVLSLKGRGTADEIAARNRSPLIKIRRTVGPTWIQGQCGPRRYALRSFVIKTTTIPYSGGAR